MKKSCILLVLTMTAWVGTQAAAAGARHLSFEDRVRAQEAIERVYYAHQIGTTSRFEDAVPRSVLEGKVRAYLQKSVALEEFWHTPVTSEGLRAELERIARRTRLPERLGEIYSALDHDAFLVEECFARPLLVDRLTRSFFEADERLHGSARQEAEALHRRLLSGELSAFAAHPKRTEAVGHRVKDEAVSGRSAGRRAGPSLRLDLGPEEYEEWRSSAPRRAGEIGPLVVEGEAYQIRVLLADGEDDASVAIYTIPKQSWETWWSATEARFDHRLARPVAPDLHALPRPAGSDPIRDVGSKHAASVDCVPEDSWQNGSLDDVPDGRGDHTAIWTGNVMIVWGGWRRSAAVNTGGRYDPLSDTWTPTSTVNAPSPRYFHSAVWTGSLMIVWGGQDYTWFLGTGGRYDPVTDTWTPTTTSGAPVVRQRHTAVWTGSLMVVWGGYNPNYLNTGARYDPLDDTWTPTSTVGAPEGREMHTAVWTGTRMIVWGGDNDGPAPVLVTGGKYDPVADTWEPISTGGPTPRYLHTAVWTGSLMIVWGGYVGGGYTNTGGRYDPFTNTWTPTATTGAPSARLWHSMVWTGTRMVVWGGWNFGEFNTGGRYDPQGDTWEATSTINAPTSRSSHTAIWTGSRMVVWGGGLGDSTGGRYDPSSNTWTPTSTNNAPAARLAVTALWTGSHMIVWGGSDGAALNTGGRYDPVSDTWMPTSASGAPSPRSRHTMVWTGSRMIVWGGAGGAYLDSGGLYDPASDTWSPTSQVGAPLGRGDHSAVWTGDRMVVWGGTNGSYLDSGGRYDPSTDTWKAMAPTNGPVARRGHTAIWTGRVMIVWGGFGGADYPYEGGRYDPVSDIWSPISIDYFLEGRERHSAVWTGTHMIVWGGSIFYGGEYSLSGGGRYDPDTDTWTQVSFTGAPSSRTQHSAVWTGRFMVVWGGKYADPLRNTMYLDTGGRYDPIGDTWTATSTLDAPAIRASHAAVWTGSRMIVWGGSPYLVDGGQYALGDSLDLDGDGFRACEGDCNDGDSLIHPGAVEICNGFDDDCDGVADLVPGPVGTPSLDVALAGTDALLQWNSMTDATGYDVVVGEIGPLLGSGGDFSVAIRACPSNDLDATQKAIAESPPTGGALFFLVRGVNCGGHGTYDSGSSSQVAPRDSAINASTASCP